MHVRVVNPNTTAAMTARMAAAAERVASRETRVSAAEPTSGPASIEGHFDDAIAAVGVLDEIRRGEADGDDDPQGDGPAGCSSSAIEER